MTTFDHVWIWNIPVPNHGVTRIRAGEPCRVIARGDLGGMLAEFEDGCRVIINPYPVLDGSGATAAFPVSR